MNIFVSDTVYQAIDTLVEANHGVTSERFDKLVEQVAATNPELATELQDAAMDYALDQTDAAFLVGSLALDYALSDTTIPASDELYRLLRQIPSPELKEAIWATVCASWTKLSKQAFDLGIGVALPSPLVLEGDK